MTTGCDAAARFGTNILVLFFLIQLTWEASTGTLCGAGLEQVTMATGPVYLPRKTSQQGLSAVLPVSFRSSGF